MLRLRLRDDLFKSKPSEMSLHEAPSFYLFKDRLLKSWIPQLCKIPK